MARPVAVLFDIDETLVHTGGSGARSWAAAFDQIYGIPADIGAHSSAGETDPQVAEATFRAAIGRPPTRAELLALYARYLAHLADDIWVSKDYHVLPGVHETVGSLERAGVVVGLVSGAMEGAARTKLMPADLNRLFIFGAYGSDSPDRAELTRAAITKAGFLTGGLQAGDVYVVGDTPHDMEATLAVGAVPVGVATGHYPVEALREAGGVHVLESLEAPFPGV